ncbi:hypothetical protein MY8738_003100 [Beauveria namnaoensis]
MSTANQQLFNVHTWHDLEDAAPPPYEKKERLPPSYHELKRADRHAATGWKGSLRRMFPVERRFETVTLGKSLPSARRITATGMGPPHECQKVKKVPWCL